MSDAKQTIEINDRETAKAVAARVGVKWPVAQGKPPKTALYNKLDELGFEVKGSYLPKPVKLAPVGAGQREYEITRTLYGKPNSKGESKPLAKGETIRVSIKTLREILHAEGMKGSLGDSRIREAVSKLRAAKKLFIGWEDADIAKAVIVPVAGVVEPDATALAALDAVLTPVEPAKVAEKAPSKPRAPRNSRARGKDTTPAVSTPETGTQPVSEETPANA
jgi:hypothetical protein